MPLDTKGSPVADKRKAACKTLMRQVHAILAKEGSTPSALHAIKLKLMALATRSELFPRGDFAMPEAEGRNHILEVQDDDGPGLYLTIGLPGKEAAPHDHGIWCVNAAISGRERHLLWRRTDDGSKPGHAMVTKIGEVMVERGNGSRWPTMTSTARRSWATSQLLALRCTDTLWFASLQSSGIIRSSPQCGRCLRGAGRVRHERADVSGEDRQHRRDDCLRRGPDDPACVARCRPRLSLWLRQR
jgi:predicted metal-dependent enzyme (double-stranded beta helix superfamily)